MKYLLFLLTIGIHFYSNAAELDAHCATKVLPSVCGSGTVELELLGDQFNLKYGDISCWFSNNLFDGDLKKRAQTGYSTTYYLNALTKGYPHGTPYSFHHTIGTVELDNESQTAKVSLDPGRLDGARGANYHLACD